MLNRYRYLRSGADAGIRLIGNRLYRFWFGHQYGDYNSPGRRYDRFWNDRVWNFNLWDWDFGYGYRNLFRHRDDSSPGRRHDRLDHGHNFRSSCHAR